MGELLRCSQSRKTANQGAAFFASRELVVVALFKGGRYETPIDMTPTRKLSPTLSPLVDVESA